MSRTFDIKTTLCPVCGHTTEAATNITGKVAPGPGDVTICAACSSILVFTEDMQMRVQPLEGIAPSPQRDKLEEIVKFNKELRRRDPIHEPRRRIT